MKKRIIALLISSLAVVTLMTGCNVTVNTNPTTASQSTEAKSEDEKKDSKKEDKKEDKKDDKKDSSKQDANDSKKKKDSVMEFTDDGSRYEFSADGFDGQNYNQFSFAAYDLVVMNFWDPRSEVCAIDMPILEMISNNYKDKKVCVVGVVDGSPNFIPSAGDRIREYGVDYINLYKNDSFGEIANDLRSKTLFMTGDCMILPATAEEITDIMIYNEIGIDPSEAAGSNRKADKQYLEDIEHVATNYIGGYGEVYSPIPYVAFEQLVNDRLNCKIIKK